VAAEKHGWSALTNDTRLRDLFERASELAPPERAQFLASACGDDQTLMTELDELLAADAAATREPFWQRSAIQIEVTEEHAMESAVGQTVGKYRLVELIGKGGMGTVYRAVRVDAEFEKCVAVKLINAVFYSPETIAHFRAERQILANLEHPNIAHLLDGGARPDGLPYLIMEFVEGISPGDYCRQHKLPIAQRLLLFRQVCSAVHYAHQNMVIHRDLKPANILVTPQGTPKLLDFGIARVFDPVAPDLARTEPGMARMTVRYSSPEQIRGEPVTTASDIYSLGVILYELLTEHSPYGDGDRPVHRMMTAVCEDEPPRPGTWDRKLKGDLDNIVLRALRKPPQERYASVDQFSEDIQRYLDGQPVQARGEAPFYLAAKFIRRNRVAVLVASLLICSLIGGLIEVTLERARADRRFEQVRELAHSVMFDYADAIDRLPGATPVRARLVKDALTYLDNLSKDANTPQLQREIVNAYVRVSNVQGNEYENNLGDTAAAVDSARKAVAAAEKLLREDETRPALDSAASAFSTYGDLLYSSGDLGAVERAYRRAIALREEIATKSPLDPDNNLALSICFRHTGDLTGGTGFQSQGRTADALVFYQQAKALVTRMAAQFPGNEDVAKENYKALISLSGSEYALGRREDATEHLREALTDIGKVGEAHPDDSNVEVELAIAEVRLGQILLDNRDAAAAIPHIVGSAGLLQKLEDADPGNAIYRERQSVVEIQWAAALRGAGQNVAALPHNERALKIAQALSHDSPGSVQYRSDAGISERELSEGLIAAGNAAQALDRAGQAETILCQSSPAPADSYTLSNCGHALVTAGNAQLDLHKTDAALTSYRQAEQITAALAQAQPLNAVFQSDWARSQGSLAGGLAKAGDFQGARNAYAGALKSWSALRQANSLTAEDAHRADDVSRALDALASRR
jgi:tetratricopeptide (TPR) repeat protein